MSSWLSTLHRYQPAPSRNFVERLCRLAARPAIKWALRRDPDPDVEVAVGRRALWMNWSHNLPSFLRNYPHYETEIGRLADFVRSKQGSLAMIDVGANIGDTVALLPVLESAKFLCIEGSRRYFNLLHRNFGSDPDVTCVHALLFEGGKDLPAGGLVEIGGTAHLGGAAIQAGSNTPYVTLDEIVDRFPKFSSANLLKIDTDGFDFRVLKGASRLLAAARPALHFELSFRLWEDVGRTNVPEALSWLAGIGYRAAILYDNLGYLIGKDSLENASKMEVFREYGLRRRDFYLNVVAFHESDASAGEFISAEIKRWYE